MSPEKHPGKSAEKPCAYCGRAPRIPAFAPFCSRGCQDRDLLQWLGEGYKMPTVSNADELTDTPGLDSGELDG